MRTAKLFIYTLVMSSMVFYTLATALIAFPSVASAQTVGYPTSIGYQGRLKNSSGQAISSGTYDFQFNLFNASSGGSELAAADIDVDDQTVTNGFFSLSIPIDTDIADFLDDLYLEVRVKEDSESTYDTLGRIQILKTPYAMFTQAVQASSASPTGFDGRLYYDTDTDDVWYYDGAAAEWQALASTLDDAYNNFGSNAQIITVDDATTGLSFDITAAGNLDFDMQSTGDVTFQDSGTAWATFGIDGSDNSFITVDTTDAISLDADAASNFNTSAGDLTLQSEAGSVNLIGAEAAADAVRLNASNAAGGIDIDAGTGGIAIDAGGASNFTTSAGALTLDGASGVNVAGNAAEVDVTTTGAVDINSAAGTWDASSTLSLDAAGATNLTTSSGTLTLATTAGGTASSVIIQSVDTSSDAIYLDADGATGAGITLDAYDATNNTTGAIVADSAYFQINTNGSSGPGSAGVDVNVGGSGTLSMSTSDGALSLDGGGSSGSVSLTSAQNDITLDTQTASRTITIGNSNVARTINVGSGTGADVINLGAGADQLNMVSTETTNDALDITFDSITTANGIDYSADGLTSGSAFLLSNSSTFSGSLWNTQTSGIWTGNVWNFDDTGNAAWTGNIFTLTTGTGDSDGDIMDVTLEAGSVSNQIFDINNAAASDEDGWLMDVDVSGVATGNAIDFAYSAAATGNAIDLNMGSNVAGDALNINTATTSGQAIDIDGSGVLTADFITIDSSGATTTDGVDGMQITHTTGNGTDPTNAVIRSMLVAGGTASTDIAAGILIDLTSQAGGTERAIDIANNGASWDTDIDFQNGTTLTNTSTNDLDFTDNSVTLNLDFAEATSGTVTLSSASDVDIVSTNTGVDAIAINSTGGIDIDAGEAVSIDTTADQITIATDSAATVFSGSADGTANVTLTAGDLTVTDGDLHVSAGDVNFTTDAGDTINIAKGAAPTADVVSIVGGTSATDGVDALQITLTSSNASGNALDITPSVTNTAAAAEEFNVVDIDSFTATMNNGGGSLALDALNIGDLTQTETAGTITATAIDIGTGWDVGLSLGSGGIQLEDDVALSFGSSSDVQFRYETADANANSLNVVFPDGDGTDVPVFAIGDASMTSDLGLFNGFTDTTFALVSDDAGDYLALSIADAGDATINNNVGDILVAAAGGNFSPSADNGTALGASGTEWADLFLNSGAVINFEAGDVTLTHSTGLLTASGDLAVSGGDITGAASETIDIGEAADGTITFSGAAGTNNVNLSLDLDGVSASVPTFSSSANDLIAVNDSLSIGIDGATTENIANASFVFSGGNDLYVDDDLGVNGDIWLDGNFDVVSNSTFAGSATFDGLVIPANAGDESLGNATNEWDGVYIGDDGAGLTFGADQDITFAYISGSNSMNMQISDSNRLNIDGDGTPTGTVLYVGQGDTQASASTVNQVEIELNSGAGDGADIYSALVLDVESTAHSGPTDQTIGLKIDDLGSANTGTEMAIVIGDNWDAGINFDGSTPSMAIASGAAFSIQSQGTTLLTLTEDSGAADLAVTDDLSFEGTLDFGTDEAFNATDTTPSVVSGSWFTTDGTAQTLTDFDDGVDGQIIFVESTDATVFDCTANVNFSCGAGDITTADGDLTTWILNGTVWTLVSYNDISDDHGAGNGFDLAEWFPAEEDVQPGDVLVAAGTPVHVAKSTEDYQKGLMGIVTTQPGFVLGDAGETTFAAKVALAGRVPTNVTTENGAIEIGDYLTSSATRPGYAMKATEAGPVIGMAMESLASGEGQVTVKVDNMWYNPPVSESGTTQIGFAETVSVSEATFSGSVSIAEHLYGSRDMAGRARLKAGASSVRVTFETEYAHLPIVTFSVRNEEYIPGRLYVSDESAFGFTINHTAGSTTPFDIELNWIAIGVEEAVVTVSDGTTEDVEVTVVSTTAQESTETQGEVESEVVEEEIVEDTPEEVVEEEVVETSTEEDAEEPVVEEEVISEEVESDSAGEEEVSEPEEEQVEDPVEPEEVVEEPVSEPEEIVEEEL